MYRYNLTTVCTGIINTHILCTQVNLTKDALDLLISGEHWDKARQVVTDRAPHLRDYVDSAYTQKVRDRQQPDEILNVDVAAALEMYADSNKWEKCLQVYITFV